MKIIHYILAICLVLLFFTATGFSQKPGIDEARSIIEEMDNVAGTYIKAPKDDASKAPVIKKLQESILILNDLQKETGGSYESSFLLARAWAMLYNLDVESSFENAVRYCSEAAEIEPENQDPHLFIAMFYSNSGHTSEAERAYSKALRLGQECPSEAVLGNMAIFYLKQGRALWAYNAARECLKYYPGQETIKTIMTSAQGMVRKVLLDAVEIHFASTGIIYRNKNLKYSFKIPPGWIIVDENHDDKNTPLMKETFFMKLPGVEDEKGVLLENVVGIEVFRKGNTEEAKEFAENFLLKMKGEVQKIIQQGPGWIVHEGVESGGSCKGFIEAKPCGEFVFIKGFFATPVTYEKTIGDFKKWSEDFSVD